MHVQTEVEFVVNNPNLKGVNFPSPSTSKFASFASSQYHDVAFTDVLLRPARASRGHPDLEQSRGHPIKCSGGMPCLPEQRHQVRTTSRWRFRNPQRHDHRRGYPVHILQFELHRVNRSMSIALQMLR